MSGNGPCQQAVRPNRFGRLFGLGRWLAQHARHDAGEDNVFTARQAQSHDGLVQCGNVGTGTEQGAVCNFQDVRCQPNIALCDYDQFPNGAFRVLDQIQSFDRGPWSHLKLVGTAIDFLLDLFGGEPIGRLIWSGLQQCHIYFLPRKPFKRETNQP